MKKIILNSDFKDDFSVDTARYLIGHGDTVLIGITGDHDGKEIREFIDRITMNLPYRKGRQDDERFYRNEAARFIVGACHEHPGLYIVTKRNLSNIIDAITMDSDIITEIGGILILDEDPDKKSIEELSGTEITVSSLRENSNLGIMYLTSREDLIIEKRNGFDVITDTVDVDRMQSEFRSRISKVRME